MEILVNKPTGCFVVHATANGSLTIAGNNSVSNVALAGEIIQGAHIRQVWFGSPSGNGAYWVIKRGANTVAVLDSTAFIDYAGNGVGLSKDASANLSVELYGSEDGYIMIELKKILDKE